MGQGWMLVLHYLSRAAILRPRESVPGKPGPSREGCYPHLYSPWARLSHTLQCPTSPGYSSRHPVLLVPHTAFPISGPALIQRRSRPLPSWNLRPLSLPKFMFPSHRQTTLLFVYLFPFRGNSFSFLSESQDLRLQRI